MRAFAGLSSRSKQYRRVGAKALTMKPRAKYLRNTPQLAALCPGAVERKHDHSGIGPRLSNKHPSAETSLVHASYILKPDSPWR